MASFSIEGLLGLDAKGDRSSASNGKTKQAVAMQDNGEPAVTAMNPSHATTEESHEEAEDTEGCDERTEQVTVKLKTVHTTSVRRSSGCGSRKRKRTKRADDEEDSKAAAESAEEHPTCSGPSTSKAADQNSAPKPTPKRQRTAFTIPQLKYLEYTFRFCPYPDSYAREQIAKVTNIKEAKIQVWFQNRRARFRKREKPLESQKPPPPPPLAAIGPSSPAPSPPSFSAAAHAAMMQAYFAAAAAATLQGATKVPVTPTSAVAALGSLPQQFFCPPNAPLLTAAGTMPTATGTPYPSPPYVPPPIPAAYSTPPTSISPLEIMAAAAQIHAAKQATTSS